MLFTYFVQLQVLELLPAHTLRRRQLSSEDRAHKLYQLLVLHAGHLSGH